MVAQVLEQASTVNATPDGPMEMVEYVISLREGIMDAWGGIIGAMKSSNKSESRALNTFFTIFSILTIGVAQALQQYIPAVFSLLNLIANDTIRSEALMRASMGVIGYVFKNPFVHVE